MHDVCSLTIESLSTFMRYQQQTLISHLETIFGPAAFGHNVLVCMFSCDKLLTEIR